MAANSKPTSIPSPHLLSTINPQLIVPAWVMLKTSSTPITIKTSDLCGYLALQGFLSSKQVLPVPPMVNDIAEALPWLLEAFPTLY
jgi:hypothetical protein